MALLASAGSRESLLRLIIRFYGGTQFEIRDDGAVVRVSDGKVVETHVTHTRGRWRFESGPVPDRATI